MPDDKDAEQPGWLLKQMDALERESRRWPERMKQALQEKESAGMKTGPRGSAPGRSPRS